MTTPPSFEDFFRAVHGRDPFPWQVRLSREVISSGWPTLLDLPTGVGKTSAIDVAVYALASASERMPRRTILVVDRRIVVDQAADHARRRAKVLRDGVTAPTHFVAAPLRALWGGSPAEAPFAVALMRGGMPKDNDWARRPDQPVVGVSTVDQVGSRLLFRGYGVGDRSASVHAGLIGNDTLLLLDEVHLAEPFAKTLETIATHYQREVAGLPRRFHVVRMSATPGVSASNDQPFRLEADDWTHPVLEHRLRASKRAKLSPLKVTGDDEAKKAEAVAVEARRAALELQRNGARVVGVVVNRVDTARRIRALIEVDANETDVLLVTGRMRPIDRDRMVRMSLLPRCGPRQGRSASDRPLIVVATQCIEAGADLDFDGLVTECASLDVLRQRFGRLDRQGSRGVSEAIVIGRSDQVSPNSKPDPIYGGALVATWSWLGGIANDGVVDFGISAFPLPEQSELQELLAPKPAAPVLLPAHLDAWSQTSPIPDFDPDIALWLHGPARSAAEVQVVWRADLELPVRDAAGELVTPASEVAQSMLELAVARLTACRPSAHEALSLPHGAARRWLLGEKALPIADVMVEDMADDDSWKRPTRSSDGQPVVALRWRGEESSWIFGDRLRFGPDELRTATTDLRPGDVLIVPASRGGLAHDSFDPAASRHVDDLGTLAALRGRAQLVIRPNGVGLEALGISSEVKSALPTPERDERRVEFRKRLCDWARSWPELADEGLITRSEQRAAKQVASTRSFRLNVASLLHGDAVETALMIDVPRRYLRAEVSDAITEDDDSSFVGDETPLADHSRDVETVARMFATSVRFSPALVADLALAGWFHDVGKADPRFQRWLVGGSEIRAALLGDKILAKSARGGGSREERELARARAGYPRGYRHELLSLAMLQRNPMALAEAHDPELVLHLVASHHGHCRPFPPFEDHPEEVIVTLEHGGISLAAGTRHGLARLDAGVADRYWRLIERYGWWGLAWLEAVLRLADHRASDGSLRAASDDALDESDGVDEVRP